MDELPGASSEDVTNSAARRIFEDFRSLSYRILQYGSRGTRRTDFLRQTLNLLLESSEADAVDLRFRERQKYYRCYLRGAERFFKFESVPLEDRDFHHLMCGADNDPGMERLYRSVVDGETDPSRSFFTGGGSFWTGDTSRILELDTTGGASPDSRSVSLAGPPRSMALLPLSIGSENIGILKLESSELGHFGEESVEFYEGVAQSLAVALAYRRAQVELRERVKELTCLYGISREVERPEASLDGILGGVVEVLPPGWLYPEIASARVVLDGRVYAASGFPLEGARLSAPIEVDGRRRGVVEVAYKQEMPNLDEGPFLKEERTLIDTIARELARIIERKKAEEDRSVMEQQLQHADRLATIGQLAAGVAHELNEPLGNILGFAQLAAKSEDLPDQVSADLQRIVNSALHAREVIRKLMIFARKMPPQKTLINLSQVVEEGLYFLESRCAKAGIELSRSLDPDLPEVTADRAQIHQVLVNLIVNSVQAMPRGGRVTVETKAVDDQVCLAVEDTGVGMSDEVLRQVFIPFFTTKDVDEGTGLGLPVVHGIVSSHGGTIRVTSREGSGTRVEVRLPVAGVGNSNEEGTHVTAD